MSKFKFVFLATLLMFLDIIIVPNNQCGKDYYYLVFEIEIVNVEQSDKSYFTNNYSDKVIIQYYKLSEDEVKAGCELTKEDFLDKMKVILNSTIKYCETQEFNGDLMYKYYDIDVNDYEILSIKNNKNDEVLFPLTIKKRKFKAEGKKNCYTLKIGITLDYELGAATPWQLKEEL